MENKIDTAFQIKQINEDENYGYIEGYASVFDVVDSYRDIVRKGAFTKSLEERKNSSDSTIPMLWSHETNNPIGYFSLNEMFEDELGLYVKGKVLLNIPQGRTAYALLKEGICKKMSIGYIAKKHFFNEKNNTRELIDIDLHEISLVMFPANQSAKILNVKSMNLDKINVSSADKLFDPQKAEENINKILENSEYKADDFYFINKENKKEGLFMDIVDGKPEINIQAVLDFSKKGNIENLQLNETEKKNLKQKINNLFEIIRKKTNDLSYVSPFEVQQYIIKDFTIKDCERFLKKSGLTNAGFKAFFQRLCELKGCRRNNREKTDKSENEIQNSLEENEQTPEELKNLNNNLRNLQILLKIKD